MRVGKLDVDLLEKVLVHEITVALIVSRSKTDVFVKIPALDLFI
jgi:hypothetical protein